MWSELMPKPSAIADTNTSTSSMDNDTVAALRDLLAKAKQQGESDSVQLLESKLPELSQPKPPPEQPLGVQLEAAAGRYRKAVSQQDKIKKQLVQAEQYRKDVVTKLHANIDEVLASKTELERIQSAMGTTPAATTPKDDDDQPSQEEGLDLTEDDLQLLDENTRNQYQQLAAMSASHHQDSAP